GLHPFPCQPVALAPLPFGSRSRVEGGSRSPRRGKNAPGLSREAFLLPFQRFARPGFRRGGQCAPSEILAVSAREMGAVIRPLNPAPAPPEPAPARSGPRRLPPDGEALTPASSGLEPLCTPVTLDP